MRTVVYVADNGLVKAREGINIRMGGVVLGTHPAVTLYPDDLRLLGRVDADGAAYIEMLGDAATTARQDVTLLIRPLDVEAEEASEPPPSSDLTRDRGPDPDVLVTLADLEAKRREMAALGRPHGYDTLRRECGVARGTVQRRYEGRVPPGTPIPGICETAPPPAHPR